jgi:methionyl aminopeptidase
MWNRGAGMKVPIKTEAQIAKMQASADLVGRTLAEVAKLLEPGVSTAKLDGRAEEFIRDNGGIPAFKNYRPDSSYTPFPFSLCLSINDEVVHGFSSETRLVKDGDIVSVDCGVQLDGFYGDYAYTFLVGNVSEAARQLCQKTKEALLKGVALAVEGQRLGDVCFAIQAHVEQSGYGIVREMVGHGIGQRLHEPPEVPNYGRRGQGLKLQEGMVICIEPMINMGKGAVLKKKDGWTIVTRDGQPSAHYEHTVVIRKGAPEVLSSYKLFEPGPYTI